ncbi:hypothetical protein SAMN04489867_0356 [Pedococcus dokdonensis]|uniref:Uncharacterized protein n=1 Tax=Pedococcus dokdonensis TaxID=443156 RepID=A0A1H0LPD3_9MICO|nr:hypothetical protein SAMN04489867_0356 [Pedococcus dokdonensis]
MPRVQVATASPAERDAVLTCAVAVVCAVAFLVFVGVPVHSGTLAVPEALEAVWVVGLLVGAFLGPVAGGLAAFVSGAALVAGGPALTQRARRLHWSTIAVSALLLVAYVSHSHALQTWLD